MAPSASDDGASTQHQPHGPVGRKEVDQMLIPKLPDRMSDEQKQRKVQNLIQELRLKGCIANKGSRSEPQWVLVRPVSGRNLS
jgi:hypothetical protein